MRIIEEHPIKDYVELRDVHEYIRKHSDYKIIAFSKETNRVLLLSKVDGSNSYNVGFINKDFAVSLSSVIGDIEYIFNYYKNAFNFYIYPNKKEALKKIAELL